ncbi:family 48 glycosyltransferase [Melampsora larici-populina 98AG31]|uniref:Family 48 glycosyltransferase n=1 Tax=Melampsora larici-populina (strain 98AG31 / pathotype 3-4-7) TaxID=747676 RepID=F4R838_MELLP|nr:family 48 glycosyltransferase [Melampsora larici-populina 98AG31]EGG11684.1 family 48 glycosyltransferase [Melampsora larici-populina 98AG31]
MSNVLSLPNQIIFAVQRFMFTMAFLCTSNPSLTTCKYNSEGQFIGLPGCYSFVPTYNWIKQCIVSIFIIFLIGYLSPVFEVFSTQIQSHALLTNMAFGGAQYNATGHGFATTQISFAIIYSCFAGPKFLRWMCKGNGRSHENSWIGYCQSSRTQITGFKKKRLGTPSEKLFTNIPRPGWKVILLHIRNLCSYGFDHNLIVC